MRIGRRSLDLVAVVGLVALAALLRLPNLATRGTWDADQGHDMLVLRSFVVDGVVPLLGPPTSIGDVHHGALYYYLLAPAAFLTGGDSPLAVVLEIALAGIAAVAVTWWLARSIGGPVAGLVAGLVLAVSTSAVDGSTFIWNPNLIALSSAIALGGAWRAWTTRRVAWWVVAALGTAVTVQCHVLGLAMAPVIGVLLVADWRRRGRGPERRAAAWAGVAWLLIVVGSYLPLAIHELRFDFSEVQAALAYLRSGGDPTAAGPLVRFPIVSLRVLSWPLTGLITEAAVPALLAAIAVIAIVVLRWRAAEPGERVALRWLGLGLLWTCVFLTVAAPSLAVVVPDLPNDHYHAFADPMVVVVIGLGAGAAWRAVLPRRGAAAAASTAAAGPIQKGPTGPGPSAPTDPGPSAPTDPSPSAPTAPTLPRILVGGAVAVLCLFNLATQPPAVNPDGGFPAAADAGARIVASTGDEEVQMRSLPDFKSVEAYAYPIVRDGHVLSSDVIPGNLVIICDAHFEAAIGAACNGPAEDRLVATSSPSGLRLADRFEAAPGRFISVYLESP